VDDTILAVNSTRGFRLELPIEGYVKSSFGSIRIDEVKVRALVVSHLPNAASELYYAVEQINSLDLSSTTWRRDHSLGVGQHGCIAEWESLRALVIELAERLAGQVEKAAVALATAIDMIIEAMHARANAIYALTEEFGS
jgi:hypothetical protein